MAIVVCKECKAEISTAASACPQCGAPSAKKTGLVTWLVAGVIGMGVVAAVVSSFNETPRTVVARKTPAELAQAQLKQVEFEKVVSLIQAVRDNTKNPASFELVDATLTKGSNLCLTYRGTNAFNAVMTQSVAFTLTGKKAIWNSVCGGQTGVDYSHAKHAL